MKMKIKKLGLDAGGKTICILNEKDAKDMGLHPLERVVVTKGKKKVTLLVDTAESFVKRGTIVVYKEATRLINFRNGDVVRVEPRKTLISKKSIDKKIRGEQLDYKDFRAIVDDVIDRDLNDLELASFITALHIHGLTVRESINMSRAMIDTGNKLKFSGTVVDKHSIGGVPGDKTSMMVVPIVAAAGLTIPKTSSRSITSPAGTADRVEAIAPVTLSSREIKKVVKKTKGCLVWGGSVDLAPADDLFIRIEHPLNLDPLLLPSVMSKKKSVGCKYLVIDIPTGRGAKMKTRREANKLAKNFKALGRELGIKVQCAVTPGHQPIGRAMGPALEARELLTCMRNMEEKDLIDKATTIAGMLFKMTGKGDKKTAFEIIKSGKAEKKFREIVKAQGGSDPKPGRIKVGKFIYCIRAKRAGKVKGIHNRDLVEICMAAGTPNDKGAGILLNKKIGERVKKGETLFTIFAEKKHKLNSGIKIAKSKHIFVVL